MATKTQSQTISPQNDIADFLYKIADMLGGTLGDFLRKIGEFFDALTEKEVQALQTSGCWESALQGVQQDLMENLANLVSDLLLRAQEALTCFLGGPKIQSDVSRESARQSIKQKLDLVCLWKAATVYFQTKDLLQAAMAYFQCSIGGGGGTGGGSSGFQERPVKRC